MSVYSMVFMGMAPFGALLAGVAADRVGAPWTVTGSGIVCMTAAVSTGPNWHASAGRRAN